MQIKEGADGPFVTEPNKRGLRTIIVNRCSLIKHSATCCLHPSKRFCCIFLELTNSVSLGWIEIRAVRNTQTFLLFSRVEWVVFHGFKMSLFFVSEFYTIAVCYLAFLLNQLKKMCGFFPFWKSTSILLFSFLFFKFENVEVQHWYFVRTFS